MSDTTSADRRRFLKLAAFGLAAGMAAEAAGDGEANAAERDSEKRAGYRETDHVRQYYDLARF